MTQTLPIRHLLLAGLTVLGLSACFHKDTTGPDHLFLAFDQWTSGPDCQLLLSDSILDSRCPADAICIWAGEATGRMTLKVGGQTHTIPFVIRGLCDATTQPCGNTLDTLGYHVVFIALQPYPDLAATMGDPIPQEDYILEVEIGKL